MYQLGEEPHQKAALNTRQNPLAIMVISTTIYYFSKNLRNSNAQSEPNSASATFKEKVCEGAFTGTDCNGDKSFKRSKLLNMQKQRRNKTAI